ncbi:hypothetical protein LPJ53_006070 [Coemansia erecta]|uniref:Nuclear pore complex protein NUP96 C-terminal domain-containing protein n=1 Tax=Coemansia erecta TaxID=147472 RepID=A0A9W7XR25_9FUNG|nr:hypothetical protein LPJ53_006070 [Coemansia erecta]
MPLLSKYLHTNEMRFACEMLAVRQPYAELLSHGQSGVSVDAGLMMAHSFRVTFGLQGQLVYLTGSQIVVDNVARHLHAAPGNDGGSVAQSECEVKSNVMVTDDHDSSTAGCTSLDGHRQMHLAMVRVQWDHVQIVPSAAGCPSVTFCADMSVASMVRALETQQSEFMSIVEMTAFENECHVLKLAAALFDNLPAEVGQSKISCEQLLQIQFVQCCQALTSWLMSAVYDSAQQDLLCAGQSSSPSAASIFVLLSGHQIDHTCLAATSYRDYHLVMLIVLCSAGAVGGGGNDRQVCELIHVHVKRFAATGFGNDLTQDYRHVYELLSGNIKW